MKRLLTFLCVVSFSTPFFLFAQNPTTHSVYFHSDKHDLTEEAKTALNDVIEKILQLESYSIEIEAHTDSKGTDNYNIALANRRAESVKTYLMEGGLEVDTIRSVSFGENNPSFSNNSAEGRRNNRRVDVLLTPYRIETIEDVLELLTVNKIQDYEVKRDEPFEVKGKKGTIVKGSASAFEFEDGTTPTGSITIELEEAYSYEDMLKHNLSTTSNGQILITGGMFKVTAKSEGKELRLKDGEELEVAFPTKTRIGGMQLFDGVEDKNSGIDWVLSPTNTEGEEGVDDLLPYPKKPNEPMTLEEYLKKPVRVGGSSSRFNSPRPPAEPTPPKEPREPRRERVVYKKSFKEKLTMSKKETERKTEELYQKRYQLYERNKANYPRSLEIYNAEMVIYEEKMKIYREDIRIYKLNLRYKNKSYHFRKPTEEEKNYRLNSYKRWTKSYQNLLGNWENDSLIISQLRIAYEQGEAVFIAKAKELNYPYQYILERYTFNISSLGWKNCDMFYDVPVTLAKINTQQEGDANTFAVFQDLGSIIKLNKRSDAKIYHGDFPLKEKAVLFSYKIVDNDIYYARQKIEITANPIYNLTYRKCSLIEFKMLLKEMNL